MSAALAERPEVSPDLEADLEADLVADLTRVVPPHEIWPDPLAGPEMVRHAAMAPVRLTRQEAEARLAACYGMLHGDEGTDGLREPDAEERAAILERYFEPRLPGHTSGVLLRMDFGPFRELRPRGLVPTDQRKAMCIVEACQIRGYLARLDAEEAASAAAGNEARRAGLQDVVSGFEAEAAALCATIRDAAPSVERMRALMRDQALAHEASLARKRLRAAWEKAHRAAGELGVTPPEPPSELAD